VPAVDKDRLRKQLNLHEGRRLKPYRDTVGKLTIGVGRNLTDRGISPAESDLLLTNDIDEHLHDLLAVAPWINGLDEVRQRVLVDMAFNLGVPGLLKFKSTLAAIKDGRYEDAAKGMLKSLWAKQVKGRATRLAEMMRTGIDSKDF
jgi:lysozyme